MKSVTSKRLLVTFQFSNKATRKALAIINNGPPQAETPANSSDLCHQGFSFHDRPPVTIIVGRPPRQRHFLVPESLLLRESEYFKMVLNGRSPDHQHNAIHLENDDPTAFHLFVLYLDQNLKYRITKQACAIFIKAYLLADNLLAENFRCYLLRTLERLLEVLKLPMSEFIQVADLAYKVALKTSGVLLRGIISVHCASRMRDTSIKTWTTKERKEYSRLDFKGLKDDVRHLQQHAILGSGRIAELVLMEGGCGSV